jgi:large subunit ribosomal protein L32
MGVPKKKVTPSKRGMRRGGNGTLKTKLSQFVVNKTTGEYQLPHHISSDGYYNGKRVITKKEKKTEEAEE